ncbi:MAG: hypothetical protein HY692_07545, partial [Cyanobacteria bacterium NC_groundwater_1444_Ag_S-0.65um_54_12]|nr:hypothetical protein [Cyanobacteria bacterium NC_groundwater_1444_Ag_S-0.65um_54_12]
MALTLKWWILSLALLSLLNACGSPKTGSYAIGTQESWQAKIRARTMAANRLLVKLSRTSSADRVARTIGARAIANLPQINLSVLSLPPKMSPLLAIAALSGHAEVQYAEPDWRLEAQLLSNDPGVTRQWGHKAIDVHGAWDYTMGDPRVIVAVVDTGVDLNHP